mmetsp:Transcript_75622/g.92900  ORF Transcript_75622/g.92900 Transcript_75622/m.92900 type:complete len:387 (+) Transcript_75622:3-1163(+)
MDCSLNGICNVTNGECMCNKQWKGNRCQLLNLGKVSKNNFTDYGFNEIGSSSWGGTNIYDKTNDMYHMFISYFPKNCGHIADTMNSHVHQTILNSNDNVYGPYKLYNQIALEWSHEPYITNVPNTDIYVLYYSYANNAPYWPILCDCNALNNGVSNGTTPEICCADTPNACSYSLPTNITRHMTVMQYTHNLMDKNSWSDINILWPYRQSGDTSNSDTNFVCKIFNNGSLYGLSRKHNQNGTNIIYPVTALNWNDTDNYTEYFDINLFPQWSYRGNEDPFLYNDINGNYHLLFHNEIPDPGHDQFFAGAHAASYDGFNWVYFGYAYDTNITFDDNTYEILYSRERPHLVFDKDGVTPLALINGALYKGNVYGNDRSFTFIQPINQH